MTPDAQNSLARIKQQILESMSEAYGEEWLDKPLVTLGGKTPRQTVNSGGDARLERALYLMRSKDPS